MGTQEATSTIPGVMQPERIVRVRRGGPARRAWRSRGSEFGRVRESWIVALDGPIHLDHHREWREGVTSRTPSPPPCLRRPCSWGTATIFQLWTGHGQDGFYSWSPPSARSSTIIPSRTVPPQSQAYGPSQAHLPRRARRHLRVDGTRTRQEGEVLNYMSSAAGAWVRVRCAPRKMACGEVETLSLVLEPEPGETGARSRRGGRRPRSGRTQREPPLLRRHTANCAILADTHEWRFGNEPSGYVAQFCSYMYSQIAPSGCPRARSAPMSWTRARPAAQVGAHERGT